MPRRREFRHTSFADARHVPDRFIRRGGGMRRVIRVEILLQSSMQVQPNPTGDRKRPFSPRPTTLEREATWNVK